MARIFLGVMKIKVQMQPKSYLAVKLSRRNLKWNY